MILVFGSINVDLVARVDRIPRPGETVLSPGASRHFGGKGANQAVAAARAGGAVQMAGAVGADGFGEECLANLRGRGVGVAAVQRAGAATGLAFITVDRQGENAITVASGANGQVAAQAVPEACFAARVCVLQMEVPLAETLLAAQRARANGARILLNYAPAPAGIGPALLEQLLVLTDVLVVNVHEAQAILSAAPRGAATAEDLVRAFGFDLIRTLGAEGADWVAPDGSRLHRPACAARVVDTTGAGDTFVGALAAALAAGQPMAVALEAASAAAADACGWAGAQPPMG